MLKKLFLVCALTIGVTLNAHMRPDPGSYAIQGEWLYFKPSIDDSYIGQVPKDFTAPIDEQFLNGPYKAATLDYTSGYRAEGVYAFCNGLNDMRLRVSGLHAHKSRTINAIFPQEFTHLFAPLESIRSKLTLDYLSVEGLVSQKIYDCHPFSFSISGGINYVRFKTKQDLFFVTRPAPDNPQPGTELQRYKDRFCGVGPEIVFDLEYLCFCRNFCDHPVELMLVANFRESLLVGKEGPHFRDDSTIQFPNDWKCEKVWRVIPVEDFRAGLNLSSEFNCMDISLEVGYEFINYHNVVSVLRNAVSDNQFVEYSDVCFQGPYVALSVVF